MLLTARNLVERHVYGQANDLIEFVNSCPDFRIEETIVQSVDKAKMDKIKALNDEADKLQDELEEIEGTVNEITREPQIEERLEDIEDEILALREEMRDSEVLEYVMVSEKLFDRLLENGEALYNVFGVHVWGRKTTGQSIHQDEIIQEIAEIKK